MTDRIKTMQADKGDSSDAFEGRGDNLPLGDALGNSAGGEADDAGSGPIGDEAISVPNFAPYESEEDTGLGNREGEAGFDSRSSDSGVRSALSVESSRARASKPDLNARMQPRATTQQEKRAAEGNAPVEGGPVTRAAASHDEPGAVAGSARDPAAAADPRRTIAHDTNPTIDSEPSFETSAELGGDAGARLRAARERAGVELSHIAAETRIPVRHLESIEAGAYDALPSRTYAIGFAKNYARAVGLDREEIADLVRGELANGEYGHAADSNKMEPGDPAKLPSSGLVWFGAIAALLLAAGMIVFYNTYFGAGAGLAPLAVEGDDASTQDDGAPSAGQDVVQAASTQPSDSGQVVFTAIDDGVWVRFYEEGGERLFEDTMENGESFELPGDANVPLINTGRPDLLAITIDGQSIPKLAEDPVTMGDVPVSARALLDREDVGEAGASPAG